MAIAALILAAIYALLPTIISLFTMASVHAMKVIMDQRLFKINGNVIDVLESIFGSGSSLNFVRNAPNIGSLIYSLGIVIVFVSMLLQIVDSYMKSLQGESAENPFNILARAIGTIFLMILVFGTNNSNWLATNGLLYYFGNMMSSLINYISEDFSNMANILGSFNWSLSILPAEQIVLIVMSFALFKSVIEAGIVYAERWLSFAFNILLGPVFVAFNASRSTSDTTKNWFTSLFQQSFTIFISYVVLSMFFASMQDLEGVTLGTISTTNNLLFKYALSLALLALYKNSERLLNLVGFRTISNTDTLREYAKGARALGNVWRNTGGQIISTYSRQVGRKATGDFSHNVANYARNRWGENSTIAKAASYMDTKPKNDQIGKSSGVSITPDGKYTMPSAKTNAKKPNPNSVAVSNMNRALSSGAGTPFSMKDASLVNRLDQIDNLKTGSTGVIGEGIRRTYTEDGKHIDSKISAAIFQGTRVSESGRESLPKTYGIVPDNKPLEVGTSFSLGKNKDGVELSYRVKNVDPIPMQNNQGLMYELETRPISKDTFETNATLNTQYDGNYGAYLSDYNSLNQNMIANFQADGFDYAWKNSASEQIAQQMFGGNNQQDVTYQRLYEQYQNKEKDVEEDTKSKNDYYAQQEEEKNAEESYNYNEEYENPGRVEEKDDEDVDDYNNDDGEEYFI